MQKQIEEGQMRRSRPGPWQYPDSSRTHAAVAESKGSMLGQQTQRIRDVERSRDLGGQLATALAWFSIGLGAAQLLAPRAVAKVSGVAAGPAMMRAMGAREVMCGVGLLSSRAAPAWQRARIAGEAADLATLGLAARIPARQGRRLAVTAMVVAGIVALDVVAGKGAKGRAGSVRGGFSDKIPSGSVMNRLWAICARQSHAALHGQLA
jgi:hypothetical protein